MASKRLHGSWRGLGSTWTGMRRSMGLSGRRPSSYAALSTARRVSFVPLGEGEERTHATSISWVILERGTEPMAGEMFRAISRS